MWGRRLSVVVAVWLAAASAAAGQPRASFPAALTREPLLLWLQRETDIAPDQVVAVTPQAVSAIVSAFPGAPGQPSRVVIRSEALSADSVARVSALSWRVAMSADCEGRRVGLGETTGYPARNLLGEPTVLRPAEPDWRAPEPGSALEAAWRAACEADFRGPFRGAAVKVAQPQGTAPALAQATVKPAAASPTNAPPPSPAVASAAPRTGGMVVQIGASTSEAEAQALLAALAPRLDGRDTWVETAKVGGKVWRRAVVGGFADGSDAARFCAGLKAAGRGCFVRPGRPAAPRNS